MTTLQIIYSIAACIALCAGIPQMKKLIQTKRSDEFSLNTWVMWICTQLVATAYAFSLGDKLLISINCAWVLFYSAMVYLIVRYQRIQASVLLGQAIAYLHSTSKK